MRKALLAPLLAALAFAASGNAGTTTLKGVVIARLPARGELVVAGSNGTTTTLRAPALPAVGALVRASANGHLRVLGHVRHATFRGVLVRTVGATSFFAAGHSVVAVHTAPARSVASARSVSSALSPGDAAEIEVTIAAGGTLDEDSVTPTPGDDTNRVTLQVTIASVTPATTTTPGSITLTINGQTLVIPLPAGTVLPPAFVANATVAMTFAFNGQQAGDDDQGDDDDNNSTTTTAAITPATGSTTTTTTSSGHHDGDGGGHDGGHGGGGDD
jgi:hypothetical protein